ncbi:hypothetical protein ACSFBX_22290 [Variovorax sp. RB2P76]|uniref:hypothetical protein n=1 Tax=Variovorax sp. RB2P76 TaxID=3443736 RepID=UPI003F47744D
MNFFSNLEAFNATPYSRAKIVKQADPIKQAQAKFARAADEQIKLIKAANDKGLWFKKEADKYHVTLKNGVAALNAQSPSFTLADAATAIKFIEAAKVACEAGEFNEMLKATNRGPRKPLVSADAKLNPPAAAPAVEPAASTETPPAAKTANKRK